MRGRLNSVTSLAMLGAVFLGALMLCWPAFWNGFPLVFADSGNYIGQAMRHYIGWNAPPFYSVFLLATDLHLTLWTPILVQALLVVSLLAIALAQFDLLGPWPVLWSCLGLCALTSLPWVTSELMADVFAGIAVLSMALLAFGTLARWQSIYLTLLACFAIAAHQSHVPLAFGLLVTGCAVRWRQAGRAAALQALRRLAPAPLVAALLIFSVNLLGLGQAAISPYGTIILAARMIGDGTALSYLRTACPTEHYRICPHLDELEPGGIALLWAKPKLWTAMGGERAWAPEARRIVRGTLAHRPEAVMVAAVANGVRQVATMRTGGTLQPWPTADGPRPLIARFFSGELPAFDRSRQERGQLAQEVRPIALLHVAVAWLGMAALLVGLWRHRRDHRALGVFVMVLMAVLGNAFITGALSEVQSRYAERIAWLLAFTPSLVLARHLGGRAVGAPVRHSRPAG